MSKFPKVGDGDVFIVDTADEHLRLACCDCGAVHDVVVKVLGPDDEPQDSGRVGLALYRNRRSQAQLRRHGYGSLQRPDSAPYKMVKANTITAPGREEI